MKVLIFLFLISQDKNILEILKQKYLKINTFKSFFTQKLFSNDNRLIQTFSGVIYVKKPNKLLFEVKYPEPQKIISDGDTVWIYFPLKNKLFKKDFSQYNKHIHPDIFLFNASKEFKAKTFSLKKFYKVLYIPKVYNPYYDSIAIFVSKVDTLISSMVVFTSQSYSVYTFKKVKVNLNLPDSLFIFRKGG